MRKRAWGGGFTLIELLLAIFIFAVVVGIVYGSYRATFHIIGGTEKQIAATHQASVTMERMREDLRSMVTGYYGFLKGEKLEEADLEGFSLSFMASRHLRLRQDDKLIGRSKITYYTTVDDDTGLLNLYRDDELILPAEAEPAEDEEEEEHEGGYLIFPGLKGAKVRYYSLDGETTEEWNSEEFTDEEGAVPLLVAINLEVAVSDADEDTGWLYRTAVALRGVFESGLSE